MVTDDGQGVVGRQRPGRRRRYEPDNERSLILAAAMEVLRGKEGEEVTVSDILAAAGLSTRAFYRHYETKEDVIRALYEQDARSFGAYLQRRVAMADRPDAAVEVWIYEMLGLAYDRRRAERVAALSSSVVLRAVAGSRSQQLGTDLLVEPLRTVLAEGLAGGWFPASVPDVDVRTIRAITGEVAHWTRSGIAKLSRREATEYVLRVSRSALGASEATLR
jgi:AcrR family transcriptional regulator